MYIYIYIYIYVCMYVCMYIYIYIHTYIIGLINIVPLKRLGNFFKIQRSNY